MTEVIVHNSVERSLKKLPKWLVKKLYEVISELREDPRPFHKYDVKKLKGKRSGLEFYRIRVGDFRIVYYYSRKEDLILILKVRARGRIY